MWETDSSVNQSRSNVRREQAGLEEREMQDLVRQRREVLDLLHAGFISKAMNRVTSHGTPVTQLFSRNLLLSFLPDSYLSQTHSLIFVTHCCHFSQA